MPPLTRRQEAEAIEALGDHLVGLLSSFDGRVVSRLSAAAIDRFNTIPNVEHVDEIARAILQLGARMSAECDAAEEAEDRRRDNPLEPDFRRLGQ